MASELHTALESFLLFRNLHPFEEEAPSFAKISESLKHNDILRSSESFDISRLEPDALQSLYLKTLKEEAKAQMRGEQDGQAQQNPRKRKLSSPRLESLEEAAQYAHLLPQLVDRLYFHYQRDAVEAIQQEEQTYYSLQGKTGDLERDGRQQTQEPSSRPSSHGVPSIQNLIRHEEEKGSQDTGDRRTSTQNGGYYLDKANGAPPPARTSVGPEARLPSNDPRYVPPGGYKSIPAENGPPYFPPLQHPAQAYPVPTPSQDAHRRHPSQPMPSPSPRLRQGSIPPPDRSSASPVILPPVPGMLRSQASPTGPLDPVTDHRPGSNMSPRPGQPPPPRPHGNQLPPPRNYPQQPYPYHDGHQYPAYHPYNNQQGYYPPQYPGPTPGASQASPYGALPAYQSPVPSQASQHAAYYSGQGYYSPSTMSTPYAQQQPPRYSGQQTPASGSVRPFQPTPVISSTSSTKWKHVDLARGVKPPGSPTRPLSREISPISDRGNSPEPESTPAQTRRTRNQDKGETSAISTKSALPRGGRGRGRGRLGGAGSVSASARGQTRSESAASHTDEPSNDAKPSASRIKPEPSITSTHEDENSTMDESSRKPGRRRRGTIRDDDLSATPRATMKRKRGDSSLPLPSPSLNPTSGAAPLTPRPTLTKRPGYILATKNLPRISSALMQNVTSHRDAYLFAKPLTEREAPGYDRLIFRPQDLKGVKSALTAGSRAVTAMAEEAGEEAAKSLWVPETEDVVPPKGIVNATQLEKELLRIFANAVMFNPDLAENRGLGPAFRTRAKTLDELNAGADDDGQSEDVRIEIGVARPVDGAVVKDAREMCADVEEAVDGWRAIGRIDDAEARDAPIIGSLGRDMAGEDDEVDGEVGGEVEEDAGVLAGDGVEEREMSEEPRPKRRRRQM